MTRFSPIRLLSGLCLTLLLASCAGNGAVDTAADAVAASAAEHSSGSAGSGSADSGSADAAGNPGGPGDPVGDDGTDVEAQGNPGAPGDVSVFEEAGVPYSVLRDDAEGTCADGVCTLLDPVVGAGNPDDLGSVDDCLVQERSDIRYDPPEEGGFFQRGATVQATVDCTVEDPATDGTDDTQTTDGDGSDTSVDTGDQPPADGSQG